MLCYAVTMQYFVWHAHLCYVSFSYPEYKAEVFRHEDYTETVDVYSYAMIFFYMLRSTPPWAGLSGLDAVTAAAVDGERPLIPRNCDERLSTVMKR